MANLSRKPSLVTITLLVLVLGLYRLTTVHEKEISWDILGYYLYLPATFIHGDPLLTDIGWLKELNDQKQLTGSLYQVTYHEETNPMYFFLMGMSLFYLPFFLVAHFLAAVLGFPADGFSLPYHYALACGGIVYMAIGLVFFRKVLRHFFPEWITALVILTVVLGTNYIHHLTLMNIEPVTVLFMLTAMTVWHTIRWHEDGKGKYLVMTGVVLTLMTLVKPSEMVLALVPLLWSIAPKARLEGKLALLWKQWPLIMATAGIALLMAMPQMVYWILETGKPIVDSYKNPGVGLDLGSPHIMEVLFSYRKGWLLYTPLMILALIGFYFVFRHNRSVFYALAAYVCVEFYIVSSWSEWWYGAGFSNRPMITTYPVLGITLGYFIQYLATQKRWVKFAMGGVIVTLVLFNQFQWWQFKRYIIDPYRTSKEYYWARFLKTRPDKEDEKLMLVRRNFFGDPVFTHPEMYDQRTLVFKTFDNDTGEHVMSEHNGNGFYRFAEGEEYAFTQSITYETLTEKDHAWIRVSFEARDTQNLPGLALHVAMSMQREEGAYGYHTSEVKWKDRAAWITYSVEYLTPEVRDTEDKLSIYLWNRGKTPVDVDDFRIEVFEKKDI